MDALQKETMQFDELRGALNWNEHVKTALSQKYSLLRKAMAGDAEAQSKLERSAKSRRKLFDHTLSLVVVMQTFVDCRLSSSRIIRQRELDEQAPRKRWRDWDKMHRRYVALLKFNLEILE
jgi:hypothetical protein